MAPIDYKNIKGITVSDEVILNTGYFYNDVEKNEILKSMNIKIKKIVDEDGYYMIFIDENDDLYYLGEYINDELICIKMNNEIKIKEAIGNMYDAIYFFGFDNKAYKISYVEGENLKFEVTLCSEDKVMTYISSPLDTFPGFFGITKNGEICYSLMHVEIS